APNPVLNKHTVTFDASKSSDIGNDIVDYQWDLDGNGSFETDSGASATTSRSYDLPASIKATVKVTDRDGASDQASVLLNVTTVAPTGKPVGISVNNGGQWTNDPHVTLFAVWPSFATTMLVSNDGGFGAAQAFPVTEQLPWTLDVAGPERLPKIVYVRYQAAQPTTETFTDDIILDTIPPKLLGAQFAGGGGSSSAASAAT